MIRTKTKQDYSLKQSQETFKKSAGPTSKVGSISIGDCISQPSEKEILDKSAFVGSCFLSARLILDSSPEQQLNQSINLSYARTDSLTHMVNRDLQYDQENHRLESYLRKNL